MNTGYNYIKQYNIIVTTKQHKKLHKTQNKKKSMCRYI